MAKTFGIISLVLGIISVGLITSLNAMRSPMLGIMIPAFIISVVGIIFGGLGIAKDDSKGIAIAGIILGTIGLILPVLSLIYILLDLLFQPIPVPPP